MKRKVLAVVSALMVGASTAGADQVVCYSPEVGMVVCIDLDQLDDEGCLTDSECEDEDDTALMEQEMDDFEYWAKTGRIRT